MSAYIVNAAPMVIQYGTQDLSTRPVPVAPENIPQHLPKFYLFTKKGPSVPQLVVGNSRNSIFGIDSFDVRKKWATHATVLANEINAEGNAQMIQRVVPDDAGPAANLMLSLDVLPTKVDLYDRNTDGSIVYDALGTPVVVGQTDGFKAKWVMSYRSTDAEMNNFGQASITNGDQVDAVTGTQSLRYPIFEIKASSQGSFGNNSGFRIWTPTVANTTTLPVKLMSSEKCYPFFISMLEREDIASSAVVKESIYGDRYLMLSWKEDSIDPLTDKELYFADNLLKNYSNTTDGRYEIDYGNFGSLAVYQNNIDKLVTDFHAAETGFIDQWSDFSDSEGDKYLFNFVSGVSSNNVQYHSFQFVDDANSVRLTEYSNLFAKGGSDGTMTDTVFADLVSRAVKEYADPNSDVQELAVNVESIIYDTGFPLQTKYDLCSFISERKDTFVVLGTHQVDGPILTASEEHSLAIALRTRLQMYPESDYFGTPVMRGMIVGRSGLLRNSQYKKRVPATFEVGIKSAKYMGAGDGRWKNGSHFDGAPGSVVERLYDLSITWVPASVRNRNWDVGLNWVQAYDRRSFFFPALKTVYNDDTSVLNSFFTAMAIGQLNKIAHATWREFSGVSHLTNAQLIQRVNEFVTARVQGRFDNRFVIEPSAFLTEMDNLRGFSWTLPIKIYAPNMKTVMTTYVQAYRKDDLAQTA